MPTDPDASSPALAPRPPKGDDAKSPRAVFGALFETVLEELERNPDFAERLAKRLPEMLTLAAPSAPARRRTPTPPPQELIDLDVAAALDAEGQIALRERLSQRTNAELAALVRMRGWSSSPVSRLNKGQLLNAIIRSAT